MKKILLLLFVILLTSQAYTYNQNYSSLIPLNDTYNQNYSSLTSQAYTYNQYYNPKDIYPSGSSYFSNRYQTGDHRSPNLTKAYNTGRSAGPSSSSSNCFYETSNRYRFSITVSRSSCPYSVEIDDNGKVYF